MENWSMTRWVFTGLAGFIALSVFVFAMNAAGLIGWKAVEREVFEQSYQYSEARKTALATYEAQLAETESQLRQGNLSESDRANLSAQAARLRVLINTERSKQ